MEQPGTPTTTDDAPPPAPPPPPPPPAAPVADRPPVPRIDPWARPAEPGQLTPGWRIATAVVWGLAFVCFIAVWKTSRELGLSTWWLGPVGEPAAWPVSMLPFLAPIAMILLAINNAKWIPWFGLVAAAVCALVAGFDVTTVPRLAIVEFAIAGAGALAAVAGLSGRYREVQMATGGTVVVRPPDESG